MPLQDYELWLDKLLLYAGSVTDERGYVLPGGEKDEKDQGWLVLAGTIRGTRLGWDLQGTDLLTLTRRWSVAVADVSDPKSAWSTFALLYAFHLSGGLEGTLYSSYSAAENAIIGNFLRQIDIRFLREASKNYNVAAGFINALRVRYGFISAGETGKTPDEDVQVMLDGYIGDGFFNDDDTRGSGSDRRIDGYSAEIIGLLLHYDEIHGFASAHHDTIMRILREYVTANAYFVDAHGEYAKWGRSIRGGSDAKKAFLWEFAESHALVPEPGVGARVADCMFDFFLAQGVDRTTGRVYKDKGGNHGKWDEYTTSVQALGYAAYGLSMASRFCQRAERSTARLPSESEDYIRLFQKSQFIVANHLNSGIHYIVPLRNKLTKLMFLWHNRITGENDTYVDMTAKFMPLPYFGRELPAPYATEAYPFLPRLLVNGETLFAKNVFDHAVETVEEASDCIAVRQRYGYCRHTSFENVDGLILEAETRYTAAGIAFTFTIPLMPPNAQPQLSFYGGLGKMERKGNEVTVKNPAFAVRVLFDTPLPFTCARKAGEPSCYGPETRPVVVSFAPNVDSFRLSCSVSWK